MKYYEDYLSKYGFSDGDQMPPDVEEWRLVIVRAINPLLKKHGSTMRLCCYDRGGAHNSLTLIWVGLSGFKASVPSDERRARFLRGAECFGYAKWKTPDEMVPDTIADQVIEAAQEFYDSGEFDCVETKVVINESNLEYAVEEIEKEFQKLCAKR